MEDKNDNGIEDKKEGNKNGILDGDHYVPGVYNEERSPFDVKYNGRLEIPQQLDVTAFDPESEGFDIYDVLECTATHEIGHNIGMGLGEAGFVDNIGHCFVKECVMFHKTNSWLTQNYFCPYHQKLIRIKHVVP